MSDDEFSFSDVSDDLHTSLSATPRVAAAPAAKLASRHVDPLSSVLAAATSGHRRSDVVELSDEEEDVFFPKAAPAPQERSKPVKVSFAPAALSTSAVREQRPSARARPQKPVRQSTSVRFKLPDGPGPSTGPLPRRADAEMGVFDDLAPTQSPPPRLKAYDRRGSDPLSAGAIRKRVGRRAQYYADVDDVPEDFIAADAAPVALGRAAVEEERSGAVSDPRPPKQFRFIQWLRLNRIGYALRTMDGVAVKIIFAIAVLLLLGCTAGFLFGSTRAALPNKRAEAVQEYTAAADAFAANGAPIVRAWNNRWVAPQDHMSITRVGVNVSLKTKTATVVPEGITTGVRPATSYAATAAKVKASTVYAFTLDRQTPADAPLVLRGVQLSDYHPPAEAVIGDPALSVGPFYLTDLCVVVEWTGNRYQQAAGGCYWPFTTLGRYEALSDPPPFLSFTVRLAGDPSIALQAATKGSLAFTGKTVAEQRAEAAWSMVLSVIVSIPALWMTLQAAAEIIHRGSQRRFARRTWTRERFQ